MKDKQIEEQIDFLVKRYQQTQSDELFSEIYEKCKTVISRTRDRYEKRFQLDRDDIESIANYKLYYCIGKYEPSNGSFLRFYRSSLKRACINLLQKKDNDFDYVDPFLESDDGTSDYLYEEIEISGATANAEEQIIEHLIKKSDQRQLIAFLTAHASDKSRQALEAYANNDSYRQAAKQIGTKADTVINRIKMISRNFDESKHGDIYDYFTA